MEQTTQNLTALTAAINSTFPDENDLKGFPGISKALIADTLTRSNNLLIELKEYDNEFETIIMKRELSDIFDKLNKELGKGFDQIKANEFNSLLKDITKIKFLIKETYISVVKDMSIRTEEEIIKTKEELNLLFSNIEELKKINTEISNLKDTTVTSIESANNEIETQKTNAINKITSFQDATTLLNDTAVKNINDAYEQVKTSRDSAATIVADFQEKQKNSIENEQKIAAFLATVETQKTLIETTQKNVAQWEQDISKSKEELTTNSTEYNALNTRSKNVQAEIDRAYFKVFGSKDKDGNITKGYLQETEDLKIKMADFLNEQTTKFLAQFNEIEGLLPGATSTGLAEAYRIQKTSYKRPLQTWSSIFIAIMVVMTTLSIILIYLQFNNSTKQSLNDALISLLKDLPFFIPTIWLASYASKQQSQYKRLQEEYAFKETNAKSFHGHKMQVEELMKDGNTDKDLLLQLVAQLVIITSQNPSDTLDNKSHEDSPPVFKLAEKLIPAFKGKKDAEK